LIQELSPTSRQKNNATGCQHYFFVLPSHPYVAVLDLRNEKMPTDPLTPTAQYPFGMAHLQVADPSNTWSNQDDWGEEMDDWGEELDDWETWEEPPQPGLRAEPGPWRWTLTFTVVAILLILFSAIALWGLVGSDWLYGTYGEISQKQWDQIADLRDRLVQLGLAPEAVNALNDALLPPHPAKENVLLDLKKAALALEQLKADATIREIRTGLYELIRALESSANPDFTPWPRFTPPPGPTLTPIIDAPVAKG
jgi:hypothetical protein